MGHARDRQRYGLRQLLGQSTAAEVVAEYIIAINSPGSHIDGSLQDRLKALRACEKDVVAIVTGALSRVETNGFLVRQILVIVLSHLRSESALPLFRTLVSAPPPSEDDSRNVRGGEGPSVDSHAGTHRQEGEVCAYAAGRAQWLVERIIAVGGVEALAVRRGSAQAQAMLFEFLRSPSLAIRDAAVQAILAGPAADGAARARSILPDADHWLLRVRRVPVNSGLFDGDRLCQL